MGLCESAEVKEQNSVNRKIEKELNKTGDLRQKLLLLGPGESGKSTCLKQMKILHHNGFTQDELMEKRIIVFVNTVQSMAAILQAMESKGVLLNPANENHAKLVKKMESEDIREITHELREALVTLWDDRGVRRGFDFRGEYHITESASYFFDNLERICKNNYVPSSQDILHTRVPTTGVVKVFFNFKGIGFEVYDVGGQRSERRKWIHCFDDVNAIIFIAAISEFDQALREDNSTNRLEEAISLFSGLVGSQYFSHCSIILFLNKIDLFREKIKQVSIKKCFKEYAGDGSYEHSIKYIRRQFEKTITNKDKKPFRYVHETCATDTTQVTVVINSVIDMIVQENLKDTGMM